MKYIVDRFEEGFAVCETEKGKYIKIERSKLPKNVKEGDVLTQTFTKAYTIDKKETEKRKKRIKKLAEDLWI